MYYMWNNKFRRFGFSYREENKIEIRLNNQLYQLHFRRKPRYIAMFSTNKVFDKLDRQSKKDEGLIDFDFEHICTDHVARMFS